MARFSPELIPEDTLDRAVEILKAVASPIRLQIVNILISGECQVAEIYKTYGYNTVSCVSAAQQP